MKKTFLLFLGACALTACNSDDNAIEPKPVPTPEKVSMELIAESSENRTYLGDDNIVHFMADDQLSVFDGTDNNKFTLSSRNNDADAKKQYKSASFSGKATDPAENLYVLYPYQSDADFSAGTITATLPATQTLTPLKADADNPDGVASGFDPAASLSVAKVSADKTFVLKNIGALIKFTVPEGQTYTKAIFQGNNNEDVAGKITVSNITGDPTYTVVEGSKTITMAGTFTAGTYYMVVLPQTYSKGFSLTLTNVEAGTISGKAAKQSVPLARKKVMNMGTMTTENNMYLGHEFVDMGTTVDGKAGSKKVYWATENVGARAENSYRGDYYTWGGLEVYYTGLSWTNINTSGTVTITGWKTGYSDGYTLDNFKKSSADLMNDITSTGTLPAKYDVATQKWGGNWRYPRASESTQLIPASATTRTWKAVEYPAGSGIQNYGCTITMNGNTMFLPATAFFRNNSPTNMASGYGGYCLHWNADLYYKSGNSARASLIYMYSNKQSGDNRDGYGDWENGVTIRPVFTLE